MCSPLASVAGQDTIFYIVRGYEYFHKSELLSTFPGGITRIREDTFCIFCIVMNFLFTGVHIVKVVLTA